MAVSGPQAMRALDDALRDIRREEDDVTKRVGRANERISKLRETELGQLQALAKIRLEPETQAQLTTTLSRAEDKAREMLAAHMTSMDEMERALSAKDAELGGLASERQALLDEASARQREIDGLAGAVRTALAAAPGHSQLTAERAEREKMAAEAGRKADQAEADREDKGRPYRDDPLFIYLWERGYGTSQYKAGNLTRLLDGWVARLVRFADARPNYAMLIAIPERLRDHAERLDADVAIIEAKLAEVERNALDTAGGKDARQALEAANARLAAIDTQTLALEDEREELAARQKQLADGDDPAFTKAIDRVAQALSGTDVAKLMTDARATRAPEDDAIVLRIEEARHRIAEEQSELDEERGRLKTLESRRRELEDIEFEFKKSRYDDPRSRFGEDRLVGDMLTEFLKGGMTAAVYWDRWRQSQDWAGTSGPIMEQPRPRLKGKSGGFSIPPGGFSPRPPSGGNWGGFSRPRSGGFSGGGFKTGGGFKGGKGFKTGGGF